MASSTSGTMTTKKTRVEPTFSDDQERAQIRARLALPNRRDVFQKRAVDDGAALERARGRGKAPPLPEVRAAAGPNPNRLRPTFAGLRAIDEALAGSAQSSRGLLASNIIEVSPETIQRLSLIFDQRSREMTAFFLSQMLPMVVGFDQAVDYAQLLLRDQYKVNTSISGEIAPLVDWISTCGLVAKATEMMTDIPAETRKFIVQEFITNLAQRVVSRLPVANLNNVRPRTIGNSALATVVKPGTKDVIFRKKKKG